MSWAEVYKINSDIAGEPLNFTDYIYDISVFGEESYVMDSNNAVLWDKFALNSCYLYGHQAIHDYVYNRLTEGNIDDLFNKSGNLGRQMNNFHNNTAYAIGGAKEVLAGMTIDTYNAMIDKFRLGYQRYVSKHLQAGAVGHWIKEVFNVDLSTYNTVEEIVMTAGAWELALQSEPLMVALTSSEYVMTLIAGSEVATEKFADAIYYAGQNEKAINVIANYDSLVQQVVNDQSSMEWIASNQNAIMVILENENFATQALASEVAMTAFGNSETAVMLICDFASNIQISNDALTAIDTSMTDINTQIGSVLNGSDVSGKIVDAHSAIEVAVKAIDEVTDNAVLVNNFIETLGENSQFVLTLLNNDDLVNILVNQGTLLTSLCNTGFSNYLLTEQNFVTLKRLIDMGNKAIVQIQNSTGFISAVTERARLYNTKINKKGQTYFVLSFSQQYGSFQGASTLSGSLDGTTINFNANNTCTDDGKAVTVNKFIYSPKLGGGLRDAQEGQSLNFYGIHLW